MLLVKLERYACKTGTLSHKDGILISYRLNIIFSELEILFS
jgi:hypothetical protein